MPIRQTFAIVCVSVGLALSSAAPALAHAALTGSTPANKSTVTEITEVAVTANEELLDIGKTAKGFVLTVRDASDRYFGDGCVTVDGDTASMPVSLTEAGKYRVAYRIVSNDGHPIEGSYSFTFAGIDGAEPAPAFAERPECGVAQDPIATDEPTEEPSVITPTPTAETVNDFDLTPWIGLATIPLIIGAIWVLIRILGRSDSEDHLN